MFERSVIGALVIGLLAACGVGETTPTRPPGVRDGTAPVLAATPDVRTSTALIDFMNALNAVPADTRGAAIDAAIRDYLHAPSPSGMLALGLTLQAIAPDAEQSRTLRAWLATEPAIPPAMFELLRARLDASDQARRAERAETARARQLERQESELAAQARAAHAKVADLGAALARAEAKIRALTSIEEEIGRSGSNVTESP